MSGTNGRSCGEDVAAYALGALEGDEAEAFRRHMADCPACREELAEFKHLTAGLPPASTRYEVPTALRRRVMREVRATPKPVSHHRPQRARPSRRLSLAWTGGLPALVVAVIVAVALVSSGSSGTRVIHARVGSAELRIAGGRADLIVHRLPPPPVGRIYEMWVQRGNARPVPTGTLFSTTVNGTASVGVPGNLHGVDAVMVTQERAGGALAPTSAPIIVAPVS